ncbi:MAG: hypothetical protein Q9188_005067, partial [Gyalolechia gomerana]
MTGPACTQAIQHLEDLGLPDLIKTSGTDKLGEAIQGHLRHKYQINLAGSEAMATSDDGHDAPDP